LHLLAKHAGNVMAIVLLGTTLAIALVLFG
jgi:hypothetical protein